MRHSRREYIADSVDNQVRQIVENRSHIDMADRSATSVFVLVRRQVSEELFEGLMYRADISAYELTRYINGGQP